MRTLKLTIAYDGTRYAGWQIQESLGGEQRTIQGALERAFQRILQEPVRVVGSGRTDAGVHAEAQIAHVRTRAIIPCARLLRAINHLLPPDIALLSVQDAPERFHARFDAKRKRYRYRLFLGPVVPPFIRSYVYHVRCPLNVRRMREEANALNGRHDFTAFTRAADGKARASTVRTIYDSVVRRRGEELHVELEGNGFLYTMVRSLVGTLIDVGRSRLSPGAIRRLLTGGERHLSGATAPAHGLTLLFVRYR